MEKLHIVNHLQRKVHIALSLQPFLGINTWLIKMQFIVKIDFFKCSDQESAYKKDTKWPFR